MRAKRRNAPRPGDVFFDRIGCVSECVPATYVILSGEPSDDRPNGREYQCWMTHDLDGCWLGGPVVTMWDTDLARLELVGKVPTGHLTSKKGGA